MDVARQPSGPCCLWRMGVMLLVSSIACGLSGHVGAARLLYSMGRDDVLTEENLWTSERDKRQSDLQRLDCWGACLPWSIDHSLGACGGTRDLWRAAGVYGREPGGTAAFWFSKEAWATGRFFVDAFVPGFGFVFCFGLLLSLQSWTKYVGFAWLVIGIVYAAYKTKRFTLSPKLFDFSET